MMELADVLDSKSSGSDTVRVRPPLPAPNKNEAYASFFVVCNVKSNKRGGEGRVLNDSPGDCQTAPPLRPGVPENEQSEFSGWS